MLEISECDGIREIKLDRPPANALNRELIARLVEAIEGAAGAGARAVLLSGRPGMFSGGLDVPELIRLDRAEITQAWHDFYSCLKAIASSPLPVAAAITGHSAAGGAVLALFCDLRVMAEGEFRIGFNEVSVGIPMPPLIYRAASRLVGWRQAERLCVGGLLVSAAEAERISLVDELAPLDAVVARARARLEALLALPPLAMGETRKITRAEITVLFNQAEEAGEIDRVIEHWFSAETQQALNALVARLTAKRG
ncbi:MAG TPA: enoyl-CoA hydratase/isomerase family protein [Thermoanaerobaculia bacterium]|nr:enoyl-CoA hydratase/isomerase family protein [Thermoanaerobaculia bacterium]